MRSPAEAESIVVTSDDSVPGVCLLRLNRPGRRNAMSKDLVERTMRWLEQAAHDPAIRAVIIHGEGRGFCAGSDLAELAAMDDAGRSAFEADSGRLARMLVGFPRPVIAGYMALQLVAALRWLRHAISSSRRRMPSGACRRCRSGYSPLGDWKLCRRELARRRRAG